MPTDFERDLSELLHSLTPEPPAGSAPPRVASLSGAGAPGVGADLIELAPGTPRGSRRRHRWPLVLAAAAVAALIAGVLVAIQVGRTDHPATGVRTPAVQTSPSCRSDDIVISGSRFTTLGRAGTGGFTYRNRSATPCTLVLATVTLGVAPTGGTPFPGAAESIRIPGRGEVVFTAHVRVTGRCRAASEGWRINVVERSWTYSFDLGVTGCRLTPERLTHRVIG